MKQLRRLSTPLAILLVALIVTISYFAAATAQDRPGSQNPGRPHTADEVNQAPDVSLPAGLPVVLAERFERSPRNWKSLDPVLSPHERGRWESEAGKLAQKQTESLGPAFTETILSAPVETAGRSTVGVQVFPQGNVAVGLVFRASDAGYYLFRVFPEGNTTPNRRMLQYYDAKSGLYTTLAQDNEGRGYDMGRWQELRVELNGNQIVCFFDGEQVFELRDNALPQGSAGVYTLALGDILFDNFTVARQQP